MTSKERYAQLCEQEPSVCLYDRPWWMDICGGGAHWDVLLYEKKGAVLGALPYFIKSRYGLNYITLPRLTQHNGIWIRYPETCKYQNRLSLEKEVMAALIGQLEEAARRLRAVCYQQSFAPEVTNWLPFYWRGYSQTTRYTYRIAPGQDYETVCSCFDASIRSRIRKAAPLAAVRELEDVEPLYRLNCMTMERQGLRSGHSLEFLRRFDSVLAEHGARKIYLAEDSEGHSHAALYIAFDSTWVYFLLSGIDPQYRKHNFQTLLHAHAIRFACNTGRGYDFEGSMVSGIEEFFRRFGAVQTPYFRIHKAYTKNPALRMLIEKKLC